MPNHYKALKCSLLFLLAALPTAMLAQPFHREVATIPVFVGNDSLDQPFAGGVDTPNHQFVDIDGDGDYDLFVRDADQYTDFYRNVGTRFSARFELQPGAIALPGFLFWFRFVDYNSDGLIDLATDDSSIGVSLYKNTGTISISNFTLEIKQLLDSSGAPVFAGFSSIPDFADLNGDSLVDFVSSNSADGSINYYRNAGTQTVPLFVLVSSAFQNIRIIGDSCFSGMALPKNYHIYEPEGHGAAAVTLADFNGNRTADLFIGDLFSNGVFFLENAGSPTNPQFQCVTNSFPSESPAITFGFNQTNFTDLDGDDDLDVTIGVQNQMQRHGFIHYENTGTSNAPLFTRRTDDFLRVLDVGQSARPAFYDYDNNGTLDLFVGTVNGELWLFRNAGTNNNPSFTLADTIFGGIAGNFSYAPAFGDYDHDGDGDLFLGRFDGKVMIYRNDNGSFVKHDSMTVGSDAVPAVADIDNNGTLDLFVGKRNGRVAFYRNGSASGFSPTFIDQFYDSISVGQGATPSLVDIDTDGDIDLFVGSHDGTIRYYENAGTASSPDFLPAVENFAAIDPMMDSAPAFADIDNDGDPDLLVGTSKGGIHFYRNDLVPTSIEEREGVPTELRLMQNYPNPFNPQTDIRYQISEVSDVSLRIYDILGREVATLVNERKEPGAYTVRWDASRFPSGVYYYQLQAGGRIFTRPMLLLK